MVMSDELGRKWLCPILNALFQHLHGETGRNHEYFSRVVFKPAFLPCVVQLCSNECCDFSVPRTFDPPSEADFARL
jgi:hypothetical protein